TDFAAFDADSREHLFVRHTVLDMLVRRVRNAEIRGDAKLPLLFPFRDLGLIVSDGLCGRVVLIEIADGLESDEAEDECECADDNEDGLGHRTTLTGFDLSFGQSFSRAKF